MAIIYTNIVEPRKYAEEVPEDLKFTRPMKNLGEFQKFIQRLHSNLRTAATIRGIPQEEVEDLIHTFLAYMLEDSVKSGVPRYQTYDPVKYPKIPFFKFFFKMFGYHIANYHYDKREAQGKTVALVSSLKGHEDDPNVVSLEILGQGSIQGADDEVYVKDLLERIRLYSEKAQGQRSCFAAMAWEILQSRLNEEPNREFCQRTGMSETRVSGFAKKLHEMCKQYFRGDSPVFVIK